MHRLQFLPPSFVLLNLASLGLLGGCSGEVPGDMAAAAGSMAPPGAPTVGAPVDPGVQPVQPGQPGDPLAPVPVTPDGTTPVATDPGVIPPTDVPPADPGTTPAAATCVGTDTAVTKRIVRLSFNQITNSIGTLIDRSLTAQLATDNAILDSQHRAFPPLQSPREGNAITDGQWTTIDAMAVTASRYVTTNFATVTGCAEATDACAEQYLGSFAEKAYRRPLATDEQTRLTTLYNTTLRTGAGATVEEAVQHTVYAILQSPQFVYRTELGGDSTVDGPLTAYELASALSYFLTDDMPDQALLDAAAQNQLSTPDQIGAQVDRLLLVPSARQNLQDAMVSYFNYQGLESLVIQDDAFTDGVRASMFHEGELFLQNTLWSGGLTELLLSRTTVVNEGLAEIYGIEAFPPAGVQPDADGFAQVELPANRTGIVTMPGFLSTRSKPTETSVVGRGLLIKNAFLCTDTPAPPDTLSEDIEAIEDEQADQTERQKAEYRITTPPCSTCHSSFDAYGLALDNYDLIGRFRETDHAGRPIDASVTLPAQIGGGAADDIVTLAETIAQSGVFAKCMGRNLINYSLADVSAGSANINSCSSQSIADAFATTDQSFSSLVKSVATSVTFANRSKGVDQ